MNAVSLSWDDALLRQKLQHECSAVYQAILAHESHMASHYPQRQPLIYSPSLHGLGDRIKGAGLALHRTYQLLSNALAGIVAGLTTAMLVGRPFRIWARSHFDSSLVLPAVYDWRLRSVALSVVLVESLI